MIAIADALEDVAMDGRTKEKVLLSSATGEDFADL